MNTQKTPAIPLHKLTQQIADVVNDAFSAPVWVIAEVTDMHVAAGGHCYLQLVEKDLHRGTTLATVRAMIWAQRWWLFRDSFLQQTGQPFGNGLKVMLLVKVTMHQQYGLSLQIIDFDPNYTLGEMARRRLEIIRRLEADGVINMNRELPFPTRPQRIAVISASEAAGYGDFRKQLEENQYGLKFYTHLFQATMQGGQTEASVKDALERIFQLQNCFDVVVIIRGGGAMVDLASFDSYDLGLNIANFPLPVITGIGHDRDQNVLDRVAHTSVKTPTAAAALLIDHLADQLNVLAELQQQLLDSTQGRMERERQRLQRCANAVRGTRVSLSQLLSRLDMLSQRTQLLARQRIEREQDRLKYMEQTIQMAQPDNILRRGFSITRVDGHAVKAATQAPSGTKVQIQTADGTFDAISQ